MLAASPPDTVGYDGSYGPENFLSDTNVSRETLDRLQAFADLLAERQKVQNLVSSNSLEDLWRRHMLDSGQLVDLLPGGAEVLVDIGSGAGFPGMVLAIVTGIPVVLVESNSRKAQFLRDVATQIGASVTVINARIEDAGGESVEKPVDILIARALAPLSKLCEMADSLAARTCLFMKGARWQEELTEARKRWKIDVETIESRTSPDSRILRITRLKRR
ncbi:MAG: 16S rRNA (guanine(527)-N(7))-methyltransferase RsmG [Pseudomonadota bacterium]|jgi:16S rRNA (guanine527-N7)-methyltransferase|nr:16S rRNA (guanine(527)-N(7))-methyltransferase RsmG [Pseudomonadota bacterium]